MSAPGASVSLSAGLRRLILLEILLPTALLALGIYHGVVQTLYRAGWIRDDAFLGLGYYQGLTVHGVVNALVFTTMFAVAFGHAVMARFLAREPSRTAAWLSFALMAGGTGLAAFAMLTGRASVLYTFYPPLQAHPTFYIGAAALVIGSWVAFFSWIPLYRAWRREHPDEKVPLAALGILCTFIVWLIATVPLAYEVLVLLLPWSLGWVDQINVLLARTLFWFFGHPLVYFWLLPAYVMYYVMLPQLAGGRLYSDLAARSVFLLFVAFSAPVGLHHQFGDPGIGTSWKWLHTILTFCVALPSLITAFTLTASLEIGARARGGRGLFAWWARLPYLDPDRWLFGYFFAGLVLFLFGGVTGLINASYSVNNLVHNTSWVPGHFHTTVAGPAFLAFVGMILHLSSQLTGRPVRLRRAAVAVPYLWLVGVLIFSTALSISGLRGEPRRTNLGLTYTNPGSDLFVPEWASMAKAVVGGGCLMGLAMGIFFLVLLATLSGRRERAPALDFPVAEPLHDEDVGAVRSLTPWIVVALILVVIAYAPALYDVSRATFFGSPGYAPE